MARSGGLGGYPIIGAPPCPGEEERPLIQFFVRRARLQFGTYPADAWSRFLHDHGMSWVETDLLPTRAAFADDLVLIRGGLTRFERAFVVWHEISHSVLHPGGAEWWLTRPQGHITVAKIERQANDFAWLFPIWRGDLLDEAIRGVDIDFSLHSRRIWRR